MKKITLVATLMLALSMSAKAGNSSQLCGAIAETAASTVELQQAGKTWEELEAILSKSFSNEGSSLRKKFNGIILDILQEAYYSWNNFEATTVKQLAFGKCKLQLEQL